MEIEPAAGNYKYLHTIIINGENGEEVFIIYSR